MIDLLRQMSLPDGVRIQDGGTAGVGLVPELEGYRHAILVDCASFGAEPGEWKRFSLQETRLLGPDENPLSLHSASLRDALLLAEALGALPPQVTIYGIQPASVEWDQPMSAEVTAALPAIAQAILDQVTDKGAMDNR